MEHHGVSGYARSPSQNEQYNTQLECYSLYEGGMVAKVDTFIIDYIHSTAHYGHVMSTCMRRMFLGERSWSLCDGI